jgi:hypothetical protein
MWRKYVDNGNKNKGIILNSWFGFAGIKEINFCLPTYREHKPIFTSPNI